MKQRKKRERKSKGKSIERDDYDYNVDEEPQRIVIKEEMMKKHVPPSFFQALYGKIIQTKSQVRDANFIWDPGKSKIRIKFFDGLSLSKRLASPYLFVFHVIYSPNLFIKSKALRSRLEVVHVIPNPKFS